MTSKDTDMRQVFIQHLGEDGAVHGLVTWVEDRKDLVEGNFITLKDHEYKGEWVVQKVYDTVQPKSQLGVRGFDNNNYEKHDGTAIKDRK